jgi:hypothetical protein
MDAHVDRMTDAAFADGVFAADQGDGSWHDVRIAQGPTTEAGIAQPMTIAEASRAREGTG